jgi:hypothetical protein
MRGRATRSLAPSQNSRKVLHTFVAWRVDCTLSGRSAGGARTTQVEAMVTLMEIFPVLGMAAMVVFIPLLSDGPS